MSDVEFYTDAHFNKKVKTLESYCRRYNIRLIAKENQMFIVDEHNPDQMMEYRESDQTVDKYELEDKETNHFPVYGEISKIIKTY